MIFFQKVLEQSRVLENETREQKRNQTTGMLFGCFPLHETNQASNSNRNELALVVPISRPIFWSCFGIVIALRTVKKPCRNIGLGGSNMRPGGAGANIPLWDVPGPSWAVQCGLGRPRDVLATCEATPRNPQKDALGAQTLVGHPKPPRFLSRKR